MFKGFVPKKFAKFVALVAIASLVVGVTTGVYQAITAYYSDVHNKYSQRVDKEYAKRYAQLATFSSSKRLCIKVLGNPVCSWTLDGIGKRILDEFGALPENEPLRLSASYWAIFDAYSYRYTVDHLTLEHMQDLFNLLKRLEQSTDWGRSDLAYISSLTFLRAYGVISNFYGLHSEMLKEKPSLMDWGYLYAEVLRDAKIAHSLGKGVDSCRLQGLYWNTFDLWRASFKTFSRTPDTCRIFSPDLDLTKYENTPQNFEFCLESEPYKYRNEHHILKAVKSQCLMEGKM